MLQDGARTLRDVMDVAMLQETNASSGMDATLAGIVSSTMLANIWQEVLCTLVQELGRQGMERKMASTKKTSAKKDACYHKVKARYKVFPSAYASGAIAKCRKVGAKNWGNRHAKAKKN